MNTVTRYKASDAYSREQLARLEAYTQLPPSPEWVTLKETLIARGIYKPTQEENQ